MKKQKSKNWFLAISSDRWPCELCGKTIKPETEFYCNRAQTGGHHSDCHLKYREEAHMERKATVGGVRVRRGIELPRGKEWRLVVPSGRRAHKASLLAKVKVGQERIAIFRVLP